MEERLANCKYEISDNEFISPENIVYPKTCIVSLFDSQNKENKMAQYGYLSEKELYLRIENGGDLNLNYCFILNFSIENYKKLKKIEPEKIITIKDFSCQYAFFFSEEEINFANTIFTGESAAFSNAIFYAEKLNFQNVNFDKTFAHFEYVQFIVQEVDYSQSVFSEYGLSFKNSIFHESKKLFENIRVKDGEVSFLNVDFGDGNISFSGSNMGPGKTTFRVSIFGKGKKDFSKVIFNGEVSFEKVEFNEGEINFRAADFGNGKIDFTRCEIGEGETIFVNANFGNGNVSFAGTNFGNGKVSFKLAEFGDGDLDFHFCKFGEGDKIFERTKFKNGLLDFRTVDFYKGRVSFNKIELLSGDIIFEASEMVSGSISFKNSVLGNGVFNFENAIFREADLLIEDVDFGQGKVSFNYSQFNNISLKDSQINQYIDLRVKHCKKLDLSNTIIKDILDIRSYEFKMEIEEIDFSGIRLLGRIYIDWKDLNLKKLIYNQNTSLRSKSEQFRMLKENFRINGLYDEEDAAYVEFKRAEAKADLKSQIEKHKKSKISAYIIYIFKWLVFDKMGLYATNPIRVLGSMLVTYVGFSFLYMTLVHFRLGEIFPGPPDAAQLSLMAKAFYFSVITFFTIGFGDFYPMGALRIVAGVEGFCGVFLMSYFTVAFVRKILR